MAKVVDPTVRFDPLELQDGYGVGVVNPYPMMAALARQSPVHLGPIDLGAGTYPVNPDRPPPVSVLTYDESTQVLRDAETYSSSVYEDVMGVFMGRTMLEMDDPAHRDHRLVVSQAFRSQTLLRFEESVVKTVVNELIDEFADLGRADLVRTFTFHFPVQVIARILGLPRADYPRFQRWALEITSAPMNWERGLAASDALRRYFAGVLAERRAQPADDLISLLAVSEVDGRRLEDEEIYSFLRLLLPAGVETTYRASGNLMFGLLHRPDQLAALMAERALIPQAIEEGLRWEPPVTVVLRRAMADTELAGVAVPAGSDVGLLLGAANHDERRWDDPDRFDIFRPARAHVAFGFGIHVCLGMHLARMETRIALECLFDRLPGLRLDPDPGVEVAIRGLSLRSPGALPVRF